MDRSFRSLPGLTFCFFFNFLFLTPKFECVNHFWNICFLYHALIIILLHILSLTLPLASSVNNAMVVSSLVAMSHSSLLPAASVRIHVERVCDEKESSNSFVDISIFHHIYIYFIHNSSRLIPFVSVIVAFFPLLTLLQPH